MAKRTAEPSRPPGRPERHAKGLHPSASLVFLYSLGAAIAFGLMLALPDLATKPVPYSEFKQMVRAGQIAEVVIDEHRIRGSLKGSNQLARSTGRSSIRLLRRTLGRWTSCASGGAPLTPWPAG